MFLMCQLIKTTAMKTKQSFEERLVGLQGNLLNFAYQLTTNREQAEDLLQDTTLKALDNEDKYVDNVNFKGWIFTIMRNIFINNYRQNVRKATVIDQTEDLYHLPGIRIQHSGRLIRREGDIDGTQCLPRRIQRALQYVRIRI